jgi:hypothetical protein
MTFKIEDIPHWELKDLVGRTVMIRSGFDAAPAAGHSTKATVAVDIATGAIFLLDVEQIKDGNAG